MVLPVQPLKQISNPLTPILFALLAILGILLLSHLSPPQAQAQSPERPYLIGWWTLIDRTDRLPDLAANQSLLTLPYNGAYNPELIKPFLDAAQSNDIKVIVDLRLESKILPEQQFRQIIRDHKDHPALYGWYISDEPYYNKTPASLIQTHYNYIKQEDPNHPVSLIFIGWPHDEDHLGESYLPTYDQLMIDWYPGWNSPGYADSMIQQSYSIWKGGVDYARQKGKSFIAVGLGFGAYEDGTPHNSVRDLTLDEYRYHTFSAIVSGADGFLYWWTEWATSRITDRINTVIKQVQAIGTEMINGVTNDPIISVSQPTSNLVYRYGVNGNRGVILAVNISGGTLSNTQFNLPSNIQTSQVEVLDENRSIQIVNDAFTDNFPPLGVHVYAFQADGSLPTPTPTPSGVPTLTPTPTSSPSPHINIPFTSTRITLDGNLNEWSSINGVTFSDNSTRGGGADNSANIKLMYDHNYLYAAFLVNDTNLQAVNGDLWLDDAVEIFIDTLNNDGTNMQNDDYQFVVNINNLRFDRQGSSLTGWDSNFTSASSVQGTINNINDTDTGYSIEMAIPWDDIGGTPATGLIIGLDLAVDDRDNPQDGFQYFDWCNLQSFAHPIFWKDGLLESTTPVSFQQLLSTWLTSTFDQNGDSKVNSLDFTQLIF
jgi:hypothetical protein